LGFGFSEEGIYRIRHAEGETFLKSRPFRLAQFTFLAKVSSCP
jgi:hypothetical protein